MILHRHQSHEHASLSKSPSERSYWRCLAWKAGFSIFRASLRLWLRSTYNCLSILLRLECLSFLNIYPCTFLLGWFAEWWRSLSRWRWIESGEVLRSFVLSLSGCCSEGDTRAWTLCPCFPAASTPSSIGPKCFYALAFGSWSHGILTGDPAAARFHHHRYHGRGQLLSGSSCKSASRISCGLRSNRICDWTPTS